MLKKLDKFMQKESYMLLFSLPYLVRKSVAMGRQFYVGKANLQGLGQNTSISMGTWVNKSYLPCY